MWTISFGQGKVLQVQLESRALAGNLIGDSPTRSISIYLPPTYDREKDRRYPVLYMLHGYTDSDSKWFGLEDHWINLPAILDTAIQEGLSRELIVVMPNAYNRFKGSMYSSSMTIGDWESFIAKELVSYIDQNYRTIAESQARGLAGHSMGGYGTIRIGMKYPEIFSALYLLSPCCLDSNVNPNPGLRKNTEAVQSLDQIAMQPFFVSASLATAAAWAPNPKNPPLYLDLPWKEGQDQPEIIAKFQANAILSQIDQYIHNLQRLQGLAMDVGDRDFGILTGTKALHESLERYPMPHQFEIYEGDHVNQIAKRIKTKVLPFFSGKLH